MPGPTRNVGAKVVLDGEKEYKQALQDLNTGNRTLASEMKKLQAEFKGNTQSTEYLTKAGELLERRLLQQQDKVAKLREAVAYAAKQYGEASETTQKYIQQLNNAEAAEFELKHAIEENTQALNGEDEEMVGLGDTVEKLADKLGIRLPQGATEALNGMQSLSTGTVAAMAAAAAAVTALYEGIKALHQMTAEYAAKADELMTQSAKTGLSTEFLQAYQYAQELVDVDLDSFTGAMKRLTDKMADARDGNEALQATFQSLGVTITDTADGSLLPAEQVIMQVIDALHEMENTTERNAVASELFGTSYQELNPIIVSGTKTLQEYMEAAKDNYVLTEDQIAVLGELDDQIQLNNNQWEGLKQQIAAQFAPASKEALENFSRLVGAAGNALINSHIIEGVGEIFSTLSAMLNPLADLLGAADGAPGRLRPVYEVLHGIAGVIAWINDAANVAIGMLQTMTIVGAPAGIKRIGNALGFGASSGNYSSLQKWEQNRDRVYASANGNYFNAETGMWEGNYGRNAGGTDSWRGGLTWVGEAGPELVNLPRGTQILSAQDSESRIGTVYIGSVVIDAKNVQEFNDIVRMAQAAAVEQMMG